MSARSGEKAFRRFAAGVSCALALLAGAASRADEPAKVVAIRAKRFEFSPQEVTLKRGEPVKLVVTSDDVVHGFFSRALGFDTEITPGRPTEVTLTPREAGRFPVICHHFCGSGHGNMKLTLVVE